MKRKFKFAWLACLVLLASALMFTSCKDKHVHTEVIDPAVAPTCTMTGLTEGKHCSVCNKVLLAQTVLDALGHTEVVDKAVDPTCTELGFTEGKHCGVCNKVLQGQMSIRPSGHWIINCKCLNCNEIHCQGLEYERIGNSYYVVGRKCSEYDIDVVIPSIYKGLPVVKISYEAFQYAPINKVIIENGVTTIDASAFQFCHLTEVTIPDSVTSIGKDAFEFCTNLTSVTMGNGVTNIGDFAFAYCESLIDIYIPNSVIEIGKMAFFACDNLRSVQIGNGVTRISESAFSHCESLRSIFFDGTIEQWRAIPKGNGWLAGTHGVRIYCTDGTIT